MTSSDDCNMCGEGTFCPVGSAEATPCAAGTHNNQPKREKCMPCDPGKYQNETGSTECKRCPDGYYCDIGSAAPLPCPGGTTNNFGITMTSEADCKVCTEGTFCPVGSAEAIMCSRGSYNPSIKAERCSTCGPGTYQDEEGSTACKVCQAGFCVLPHRSNQSFNQCAKPTCSQSLLLRSTSLPCPAADSPNVLSCLPCPINEYCEQGVSRGVTCPFEQSTSEIGATGLSECMCKDSYYLHNLTCVECPNGVDCSRQGVRLEALPLEAGYWRTNSLSSDVRDCFTADACIGFDPNRTSVCAEGHEGAFCEVCQSDYQKGGNGMCAKCGGSMAASLVLPILFLFALMIAAVVFCCKDREGLLKVLAELEVVTNKLVEGSDLAQATEESVQEKLQEKVEEVKERVQEAAQDKAQEAVCNVTVTVSLTANEVSKFKDNKRHNTNQLKEEKKAKQDKLDEIQKWLPFLTKLDTRLRILISFIQVLSPIKIVYNIPFPSLYDSMLQWLNIFQARPQTLCPLLPSAHTVSASLALCTALHRST
eukprot:5665767-Prymnesium_polylepis.1